MKRRSMVLSIGALATGSGAVFSSAALSNTATTSSSSLDVFSVGNLNVKRGRETNPATSGNAQNVDYSSTITVNNGSDLPDAYVSGTTQDGDLTVNTAVRNSASSVEFQELLEVTNQGTTDVNVGFGFSSFGESVGASDDDAISIDNVLDAYTFTVADTETNITPTSSTDDATTPDNYQTVSAGESFYVDFEIDLSVNNGSSLVSQINDARSGDVSPSFNGSGTGDAVTLVDEIQVGTDGSST